MQHIFHAEPFIYSHLANYKTARQNTQHIYLIPVSYGSSQRIQTVLTHIHASHGYCLINPFLCNESFHYITLTTCNPISHDHH